MLHALSEGLRWGEPAILDRPEGHLLWAVPLMVNSRTHGGLLAYARVSDVSHDGTFEKRIDLRRACTALREMAEAGNLTNAAHLARARAEAEREQRRAEAIHAMKLNESTGVMEVYLREEPELLSAIRRQDRHKAVEVLNRILVYVYGNGGDRVDHIKSLIMELVVTMCRTAVEAGGAPEHLLGANYGSLVDLGKLRTEEEVSRWLVGMLDRIMDALLHGGAPDGVTQLRAALDYIEKNYAEDISRTDAAAVAFLSPSHFSRLLKQKTGHGFTELLNQVRVDHAASLLRRTDKSLLQIALEVGFSDQSYFTKVFRRQMSATPGEYRQRHSAMH